MADKIHHLPILADAAVRGADPRPPASQEDVGEDELLQVGELAKRCGKTVRAIHHYENLGLLTPHKRSKGRYRLYAPDAVERVEWIGKLNDLGMSLTQIQAILKSWEKAPSAPEAMATLREVYVTKLAEVRGQIAHLEALERELALSLQYLDTCETCGPDELTAACSACTVHDENEKEPPLITGLYAN
ncbi:MAG: MerR family transcriptional regulator [Polyangiaceae bacterium]